MSHSFRMQIEELFRLPERRTVFAVRIDGFDSGRLFQACQCRLEVDGLVRTTIDIAGEMWMNPRDPAGPRALWTLSDVPLEPAEVRGGRCVLVRPV